MTVRATALAIACTASFTAFAIADVPKLVNVQAGDLAEALESLARQCGVYVIYPSEQLKGFKTAGASGSYEPREAFQKLIDGTPLILKQDSSGAFLIVMPAVDGRKATRASMWTPFRLAQATDAAQGSDGGASASDDAARKAVQLDEVVVSGKIDFVENDVFGAAKMGLSILDTPQTVTVITSDMMEVMQIRNLDDVNRVMPGSSRTHDFMGNEKFFFRGFENGQDNTLRVDGFRFQSDAKLNPLLYERIEVIQGATSTVYGQNNPSGTVNVVSKVPEKEFALRLRADGGSNDYTNIGADLTGSIGSSNWGYRLLAGSQEYGTHYDNSHDDKLVGAAMLQYDDGTKRFLARLSHQDRDASTMRASYFQLDRPLPTGVTLANALAQGLVEVVPLQGLPRSRLYGMPWGTQDEEVTALQAQFEYKFDNQWLVRAHYQKAETSISLFEFDPAGPISVTGTPLREELYREDRDDGSSGFELNLFGPFSFLGREHTLFIGMDHATVKWGDGKPRASYLALYGANYVGTRFNYQNPDYAAYSPSDFDTLAGTNSSRWSIATDELVYSGASAQLLLNPVDRLKVLLGVRYSYDTVASRAVNVPSSTFAQAQTAYAGAATVYEQHRNTVGQFGVTYEIFDKVNLYAAYGETFTPTTARQWVDGDPAGRAIGTQDGENTEVGIKAELGTWSARLTAFDAQRTNIVQPDPLHTGFSLPIGNQTGRGVETAIQGQILPRLNVFGGVTWLDAKFREGRFAGMRPQNAPDFSLSLFSTYEFERFVPGLGVGFGLTHKRDLRSPNTAFRDPSGGVYTVDLGDITEVDAQLFYSRSNWDVYISGTNLTGERYVTASNANFTYNTHINPGREVRAGVKYLFR